MQVIYKNGQVAKFPDGGALTWKHLNGQAYIGKRHVYVVSSYTFENGYLSKWTASPIYGNGLLRLPQFGDINVANDFAPHCNCKCQIMS